MVGFCSVNAILPWNGPTQIDLEMLAYSQYSPAICARFVSVYIVQKSKKDEGIVEKINKSRALVKIGHTSYHVPFTMIEIKTK